jgi:hypothetical protein
MLLQNDDLTLLRVYLILLGTKPANSDQSLSE